MRQVWKYNVGPDESPIQMPEAAEILSAGFQDDKLVVWALGDIEARLTPRKILIRGTGHNIRLKNIMHIQTVFRGALVFHIFENLD